MEWQWGRRLGRIFQGTASHLEDSQKEEEY